MWHICIYIMGVILGQMKDKKILCDLLCKQDFK
jgi:hypothetical protein